MTSPTVSEVSSTVTELRHTEAPCDFWSQLYHSQASGELPAALTPAYQSSGQTIEVSEDGCINVSAIFMVATGGLTILWERERERTYEDDLRVEVSALWAEDWDSEDDAVYDDW
jgi:hypothetical protein